MTSFFERLAATLHACRGTLLRVSIGAFAFSALVPLVASKLEHPWFGDLFALGVLAFAWSWALYLLVVWFGRQDIDDSVLLPRPLHHRPLDRSQKRIATVVLLLLFAPILFVTAMLIESLLSELRGSK
jgi:hypothetical protein